MSVDTAVRSQHEDLEENNGVASAESGDARHNRYGSNAGRLVIRQPHRRQQFPRVASNVRPNRHGRRGGASAAAHHQTASRTGRTTRNRNIGDATNERALAISLEQHRLMEEKHDQVMAKVINNQIEMQNRIDRMAKGF
eukprot:SAG31_NODE_3340_length_4380_cov_23.463119_4_plen_139_part_00